MLALSVLTALPTTPSDGTGVGVATALARKYLKTGVGGNGGVMRNSTIRASSGGVGRGMGVGVATGWASALKILSSYPCETENEKVTGGLASRPWPNVNESGAPPGV